MFKKYTDPHLPTHITVTYVFTTFPALCELESMPGKVLQPDPQQVEKYRHGAWWRRDAPKGELVSSIETKDTVLAENPSSVQQRQREDCEGVENEGPKASLVTDVKVVRGQTCHAKKLGFSP